MITESNYRSGLYTPSEKSLLIKQPNDTTPVGDRRAIIVLHGHGASATQWTVGNFVSDDAQALADAGYYVFAIDGGGTATWNADAATGAAGAITGAYGWLVAQGYNAKVGLMGWSMGGGNALQWIKNNPTLVSGALLWAPMSDLAYFHANGTAGQIAEIDTAYAGDYAVNSVGHRISDEYATWRDKCPIKLIHGDADPTVPIALSQAFVAGVNQSQVTLTTVAGADHTTIFSGVTTASTVAFFDAAAWAA